jgi:hypothetical protein
MSTTFGRTLAANKEDLAVLEGTGGFEVLCKVIGSADHIVNTLKDWSNEEVCKPPESHLIKLTS